MKMFVLLFEMTRVICLEDTVILVKEIVFCIYGFVFDEQNFVDGATLFIIMFGA